MLYVTCTLKGVFRKAQKQPIHKSTAYRILQICEAICFLALVILSVLYFTGKWPDAMFITPGLFMVSIFLHAAKAWRNNRTLAILNIIEGCVMLVGFFFIAKILLR